MSLFETEEAVRSGALAVDASEGVIEFWTPGAPQTAGSKAAFKHPKSGKIIVTESSKGEAGKRKKAWRADLQDRCADAMADAGQAMFEKGEALMMTVTFVRARPGQHFGTGRNSGHMKDWARHLRPTTIPDVLKMARAAEDALKGVAYEDDSSIVIERLAKIYSDQAGLANGSEGTGIRIERAPLGYVIVPGKDRVGR